MLKSTTHLKRKLGKCLTGIDMQLDEVIKKLSEPEKLIDPREINTLQSYLNGYITELEEEEWERQLVASNRLAELNIELSAAKAEVQWKVSNEYRSWKGTERTVKKLKRYRSDLKDRFKLLTGQRY